MNVLLVVDDRLTRRQLSDFFVARGHRALVCSSPTEAVAALGSAPCPYAFIDLGMQSAVEVLQATRAVPGAAGEPPMLIALTDSESLDVLRAAFEAGADDYLRKPVEVAALQLRLAIGDRRLQIRTQRRLAETAAEHNERRYRTLIETINEGWFQIDAEGQIEGANSRLAEITGFTIGELTGENADELLVEPSILRRLPGQTLLGSGTGSEEYSLPLRRKDGRQRWVQLTGAPLIDRIDGHVGAIGVVQDISAEKKAEEALRHREEFFRVLWENVTDLVSILDIDGRILYQSVSCQQLLGFRPESMVGRELAELLHEDDRDGFTEVLENVIGTETDDTTTMRICNRHGQWSTLEARVENMTDNPIIGGVVVTAQDVTERRAAEEALRRERAFFRKLFSRSPAGIAILDAEGRVVDVNQPFFDLFQWRADELVGKRLTEIIVPEDLLDEGDQLLDMVLDDTAVQRETERVRRDGERIDVSVTAYAITLAGKPLGAYAIYTDITQRKQAERRLFHEAFHDALTGLPNRTMMTERLQRALRRTRRGDYHFALIFLDLDRFKVINDSLGHAAGDQLLVEMARRLEDCLRPGDTVARLGGDEFTLILEDLAQPSDATLVADRVLSELSRPVEIEGKDVVTSGSLGLAFSATGYESAEDLIRDADIAMYRAKQRGKGRYEVFDSEMHDAAVERLELENDLRAAIDEQSLVLHYQPIVSLVNGRIAGFEALIRWPHPTRGLIAPDQLIPLAEETGLIVPLGQWVLQQACRQVVAWEKHCPDSDCLLITVNLSVRELSHPDFLDHIASAIADSGAKPASIGLEITESLMMKTREPITDILWHLRRKGFRIYIDDFGTGYSSLSILHGLPIDTLKIDRSFIQALEPGGGNFEIVRAVGALGESLALRVVAEGIETPEQLDHIRRLEIPYAQGYYFGKPTDAETATKLIEKNPRW
ncbi:MAG: EAL domain-containing protein [Acidobacteriota bacterium]